MKVSGVGMSGVVRESAPPGMFLFREVLTYVRSGYLQIAVSDQIQPPNVATNTGYA